MSKIKPNVSKTTKLLEDLKQQHDWIAYLDKLGNCVVPPFNAKSKPPKALEARFHEHYRQWISQLLSGAAVKEAVVKDGITSSKQFSSEDMQILRKIISQVKNNLGSQKPLVKPQSSIPKTVVGGTFFLLDPSQINHPDVTSSTKVKVVRQDDEHNVTIMPIGNPMVQFPTTLQNLSREEIK